MPREGDNADVRWFDVEPCFVFHPLNAYDRGGTPSFSTWCGTPRCSTASASRPNEGTPTLDRWTVDLADGKVRESRFDDHGQEFPRVDERLVGKRHRYGYAPAFGDGLIGTGTLLKHDFVAGQHPDALVRCRKGVGRVRLPPLVEPKPQRTTAC